MSLDINTSNKCFICGKELTNNCLKNTKVPLCSNDCAKEFAELYYLTVKCMKLMGVYFV